jgi:hypothetical protein
MTADNPREIAEYQSDHDVLIELRTETRGVRTDIQKLSDGTATRILDHEIRLRALERRVWIASGGATVVGIIGGWLVSIIRGNL